MQKNLEKENLFGNMSWILSSRMDLMSVKWLFFDVKFKLFFCNVDPQYLL